MVAGGGVTWVFEEDDAAASGQPDALAEIPLELRERIEDELRRDIMDQLHSEAVARGTLPAPPRTYFDALPGRIVSLLFQAALGAAVGALTAGIVIYSIRSFATIL